MSLTSSPGKMDLSALGGLKKRAPQPVQSPILSDSAPADPAPETAAMTVPQAREGHVEVPAPVQGSHGESAAEPASPSGTPSDALAGRLEAPAAEHLPVQARGVRQEIQPADEEHSGHVTLYLPKDLNQWLGEHHDSTGISYPGIVLNAISWAAADNKFAEIFAPDDSPIPANDIFGRAPTKPKPARGAVEPETRPLRFRKDHMRVIISLARTWTADNRNAFFVGVLTAFRRQQNGG